MNTMPISKAPSQQLSAPRTDNFSTTNPLYVAIAGKGGVGKTSVVAGLMRLLSAGAARNSRGMLNVLGVDADPSALLGTYLGWHNSADSNKWEAQHASTIADRVRTAARSGLIERPRERIEQEIVQSVAPTLYGDLLTMGRSKGHGCYCAANNAIRRAIGSIAMDLSGTPNYDVVLIDCEPGMEIFSRGTLDDIDMLIVVSEPTRAGLLVANQIWDVAEDLGLDPATSGHERIVFLNKVRMGTDLSQLGRYAADLELVCEWKAPFDTQFEDGLARGKHIGELPGNGPFMGEVTELAVNIYAQWVNKAANASSSSSQKQRGGFTGPMTAPMPTL